MFLDQNYILSGYPPFSLSATLPAPIRGDNWETTVHAKQKHVTDCSVGLSTHVWLWWHCKRAILYIFDNLAGTSNRFFRSSTIRTKRFLLRYIHRASVRYRAHLLRPGSVASENLHNRYVYCRRYGNATGAEATGWRRHRQQPVQYSTSSDRYE